MKRVAELMYLVEAERDNFLKGALNPTPEEAKMLWMCGVRNQQYFTVNGYIFMTFEYAGHDFAADMNKMSTFLDSKGLLIKKRRKDVPLEERATTSWWAPVKRLASLFESAPAGINDTSWDTECLEMYNGIKTSSYNISYSDDDWSESMHF